LRDRRVGVVGKLSPTNKFVIVTAYASNAPSFGTAAAAELQR
jgi:hypothetical protein